MLARMQRILVLPVRGPDHITVRKYVSACVRVATYIIVTTERTAMTQLLASSDVPTRREEGSERPAWKRANSSGGGSCVRTTVALIE